MLTTATEGLSSSSSSSPSSSNLPVLSVLTVDEAEDNERLEMAFSLYQSCCVIWTCFFLTYCVVAYESYFSNRAFKQGGGGGGGDGGGACAGDAGGADGTCHHEPTWHFVLDCFLDLGAKLLYTSIIVDGHGDLIDPSARAERRLKELRDLISVVWESSSDMLVVSSREVNRNMHVKSAPNAGGAAAGYIITTTLSPKAITMLSENGATKTTGPDGGKTPQPGSDDIAGVVFHSHNAAVSTDKLLPSLFTKQAGGLYGCEDEVAALSFKYFDRQTGVHQQDGRFEGTTSGCGTTGFDCGASGFSLLVRRAWAVCDGEINEDDGGQKVQHSSAEEAEEEGGERGADAMTLLQELTCYPSGKLVQVEAKVTKLGPRRLVIVVRDVTERTARHEAEKRFIAESTARSKVSS